MFAFNCFFRLNRLFYKVICFKYLNLCSLGTVSELILYLVRMTSGYLALGITRTGLLTNIFTPPQNPGLPVDSEAVQGLMKWGWLPHKFHQWPW